MKQVYLVLLLMVFLAAQCHSAFAEDASAPKPANTVEGMEHWKSYIDDGNNLIMAPARWDGNDWLKAGLVVGGTGLLYVFDEKINNWVQNNRTAASNDISAVVVQGGNELFMLPAVAALYAYGHFYDSERGGRAALLSAESWFYSTAATLVIKQSIHRHRPKTGDGNAAFDGPSLSMQNDSFPSGHVSTAWSIATVIATEYEDYPLVPPLAYTGATLVALSRVHDAEHWSSDVFFTAATGYFIANALTDSHRNDTYGRIVFIPYTDGKTIYALLEMGF